MAYFSILLPLGLILILSKTFSKICNRYKLPTVVGLLLAGIVIGFIRFIPGQEVLNPLTMEGLGFLAKIGVVLIMFTAGLETDLNQIKKVGLPVVIITLLGVLVPMGLGFLVATLFHGGFADMTQDILLSNLFYGVILTATSVSVSVAALRDLGHLSGKAGTTIVTAAILDDIIGVVVLSFITAMKGGEGATGSVSPGTVVLKTCLFFVFVIVVGLIANKIFMMLDRRFPHHRLMAVYGVGFCFLMAYISEAVFGVADITGAFAAGLFLSKNPDAGYIDRKSDEMGYLIFTPVFFCNIGISTDLTGISMTIVLFGIAFIAAGLIGKLGGCFAASKLFGYSSRDAAVVGLGMMVRAEVALVCAQKGLEYGLVDADIMPFIVILILISSLVAPICMKKLLDQTPPADRVYPTSAQL